MAARKGRNKGLTAAGSLLVVVWDPGFGPRAILRGQNPVTAW